MKKMIIPCLIILFVLCAACVGGGFYIYNQVKNGDFSSLGFLSIFSGKQEDLGVTFTQADSDQFFSSNGLTVTNTCPNGQQCLPASATFIGTKAVDTTLTNTEATAVINEWITLSKNAPFSSAQILVNSNGTVDFAGTVDMTRLNNFAVSTRVPSDVKDMAIKFVSALGNSFPVSASGTVSVTNNKVSVNFTKFNVGIIPVPSSFLQDQSGAINNFIEDRLKTVTSLNIEELSFKDGKTTFKGTLPETIVYVK